MLILWAGGGGFFSDGLRLSESGERSLVVARLQKSFSERVQIQTQIFLQLHVSQVLRRQRLESVARSDQLPNSFPATAHDAKLSAEFRQTNGVAKPDPELARRIGQELFDDGQSLAILFEGLYRLSPGNKHVAESHVSQSQVALHQDISSILRH